MYFANQPKKAYYMDRLGNMSTSSSVSSSSSSQTSGATNPSIRKQILPLKPKSQSNFVQRLEHKSKKTEVPVTTLELKRKDKKAEKTLVTNLQYRKPQPISRDVDCLLPMRCPQFPRNRRPGSPSSSGYETDSLVDLENMENYEVLAALVEDAFNAQFLPIVNTTPDQLMNIELDMLHSHPVWGPTNNVYQI